MTFNQLPTSNSSIAIVIDGGAIFFGILYYKVCMQESVINLVSTRKKMTKKISKKMAPSLIIIVIDELFVES